MTISSFSGQPLPPNRKVRRKKQPNTVDFAEERAFADDAYTTCDNVPPVDRAASRRRFFEGMKLCAGVTVTLGAALLCVWGLVRYTRTSPRFAIKSVSVQGSLHRTPDDIARTGLLTVGQNIFTTDLEAARDKLLNDPWIERVNLRRRLPSSVLVDVVEREAHAVVAMGADLYLSTRQGELFKKVEPGDPFDLPVVTGIKPEDVANDRSAAVALIRRALDVVADYEHSPQAKTFPVAEAHLEDDGGIVLVVGKDGLALHLGRGPYRQTLDQANRVMAELSTRRGQASVVFLDNDAHPERVVVRMR
jgi:cell division protein FtsQ